MRVESSPDSENDGGGLTKNRRLQGQKSSHPNLILRVRPRRHQHKVAKGAPPDSVPGWCSSGLVCRGRPERSHTADHSCYSRMTVSRGVAQRWRKGGAATVFVEDRVHKYARIRHLAMQLLGQTVTPFAPALSPGGVSPSPYAANAGAVRRMPRTQPVRTEWAAVCSRARGRMIRRGRRSTPSRLRIPEHCPPRIFRSPPLHRPPASRTTTTRRALPACLIHTNELPRQTTG